MTETSSITLWIQSLQAGEQEAVQKLWDRYFHRLRGLVAKKLPENIKRSFDEEDVALSAFQSFVEGVHQGKFADLGSRDNLWAILAVIATRKSLASLRKETRQKRGGGAVRGESAFHSTDDDSPQGIDALAGGESDHEMEAQFVEECERLLGMLPNEEYRTIGLLKMQGYSIQEIAESVGCSKRAVERRLEIIRRTWRDELPEAG